MSTAVKPCVKTLCNELVSVSDWRKLGLNLDVQDYELDQIERSRPAEGIDGWKRETFSLWLRHKSSASWGDVVEALQRMRENTVAERIELKYIMGPEHASKLHDWCIGMYVMNVIVIHYEFFRPCAVTLMHELVQYKRTAFAVLFNQDL